MVRERPGVEILEERSVCGLTVTPDRRPVTGGEGGGRLLAVL